MQNLLHLMAECIPFGIRVGDVVDWPDYELLPITDEEVYPAAGPSYLGRASTPQRIRRR